MIKILLVLLLLLSNQGLAAWSRFAIVTPENQSKYHVKVEASLSKQNGSCTVKLNTLEYPSKHAWLILTSKKLSNQEQALRGYIWGEDKAPSSLILKAKLNPAGRELITSENNDEAYYKLTISKEVFPNAYIYIDFPAVVFDGGYYYSINLGAYCVH